AEIAEPGARPFLIGRRALGDRDQRATGQPVLQRRQLDLADLGAEIAERADGCSDAALRAVADLVIGLMEMVDDADLEVFDAAAELRGVIRNGPRGAGWIAGIVACEGLQHQRAILCRPRHRPDVIERERGRRDPGAADEAIAGFDAGNAAEGMVGSTRW